MVDEWKEAHDQLEKKVMQAVAELRTSVTSLNATTSQLSTEVAKLNGAVTPTYELYQQVLKANAERDRLAAEAERQRREKEEHELKIRELEARLDEKDELIRKAGEDGVEKYKEQNRSKVRYWGVIVALIAGILFLLGWIATHVKFNP